MTYSSDPALTASVPPIDQPLYGATFVQAVRRFFVKYATFSGRASRSEFWFSHLFVWAVVIVLLVPGIIIGAATGYQTISTTTGRPTFVPGTGLAPFAIAAVLFYLAILVPSIAVAMRRLHDANFSGALYLVVLTGGIGGIVLLVLCSLPTNPAGARYDAGAPPIGMQPPAPGTP